MMPLERAGSAGPPYNPRTVHHHQKKGAQTRQTPKSPSSPGSCINVMGELGLEPRTSSLTSSSHRWRIRYVDPDWKTQKYTAIRRNSRALCH